MFLLTPCPPAQPALCPYVDGSCCPKTAAAIFHFHFLLAVNFPFILFAFVCCTFWEENRQQRQLQRQIQRQIQRQQATDERCENCMLGVFEYFTYCTFIFIECICIFVVWFGNFVVVSNCECGDCQNAFGTTIRNGFTFNCLDKILLL